MKKVSSFYKNIATLMTGTGIAQIIPFVVSPIVSRLYTPDHFGSFTLFASAVNVLFLFTTIRYERAIVLPEHDDDAFSVFKFTVLTNVSVVCLLGLILFFLSDRVAELLNLKESSFLIFLIPVYCFLYGLYQSLNYLANRYKKFRSIAIGNVGNSGVVAVSQLNFSTFQEVGLVFAVILGRLGTVLVLCWELIQSGAFKGRRLLAFDSRMISVIKKYREFPLFAFPNAVVNTFSSVMPVFLLGYFFDKEVTGQYGWAVRLIQAPIALVAAATYQVFYQKASESYNKGLNLIREVKSLYRDLFLIGVGPLIIGLLFAPQIFAFAFGEEWRLAGKYTQYLLPWFFMVYLNTPMSAIIYVYSKQKLMLILEIVLAFFRVGALYLGFYYNSAEVAILAFSGVGLVYHLFLSRLLISFSASTKLNKE